MGNRLHYCTRRVIDYAGGEFNWGMKEIADLLCEHGCRMFAENTEDPSYAEEFSVPFENIENLINDLKKMNPKDVILKIDGGEYDVEEVLGFFQDAYDNAEKDNSDIYFSWF